MADVEPANNTESAPDQMDLIKAAFNDNNNDAVITTTATPAELSTDHDKPAEQNPSHPNTDDTTTTDEDIDDNDDNHSNKDTTFTTTKNKLEQQEHPPETASDPQITNKSIRTMNVSKDNQTIYDINDEKIQQMRSISVKENAIGGSVNEIVYNEMKNIVKEIPIHEIRDETRRGRRCYIVYKWWFVGILLITYFTYLIIGYINKDSVSSIQFAETYEINAPFIYVEFWTSYDDIEWVYIESISYWNLTSKKYESFSFLDTSQIGIKYFEFVMNSDEYKDIVENYQYSDYSDYWVFIYEDFEGNLTF